MTEYPARTANKLARERLIAEYPQRYRELQVEEYAKLGAELPKTPAEKAQAKVSELLEQYPDLLTGAVLAAETAASEAAHEAEEAAEAAAPPAAPPGPGIRDDAELPEGHDFFGEQT